MSESLVGLRQEVVVTDTGTILQSQALTYRELLDLLIEESGSDLYLLDQHAIISVVGDKPLGVSEFVRTSDSALCIQATSSHSKIRGLTYRELIRELLELVVADPSILDQPAYINEGNISGSYISSEVAGFDRVDDGDFCIQSKWKWGIPLY